MTEQPEALRIAEELLALFGPTEIDERAAAELRRLHERETELAARLGETIPALEEAAAELDRLHELNVELVEALKTCEWVDDGGYGHAEYDPAKVAAALAKAEGK